MFQKWKISQNFHVPNQRRFGSTRATVPEDNRSWKGAALTIWPFLFRWALKFLYISRRFTVPRSRLFWPPVAEEFLTRSENAMNLGIEFSKLVKKFFCE